MNTDSMTEIVLGIGNTRDSKRDSLTSVGFFVFCFCFSVELEFYFKKKQIINKMPDDNTKLCYKKHSGSAIAAYASTSNFVLALDFQVERLIEKSFHWSKALFHVSLHLNYC